MSDLIKVADAWEKTRRGNNPGTYIVAVAGGLKFLLLRKHREDANGSTWTLFVTARPPRQEKPQLLPSAGARAGDPAAESGSKEARDHRVAELAEAFDRRGPDDEIPF